MDSDKIKQEFYNGSIFSDEEKEKLYLESGHVWQLDEAGKYIDTFAVSYEHHNGPRCIVCDYDPCWHCSPIPEKSECYKTLK